MERVKPDLGTLKDYFMAQFKQMKEDIESQQKVNGQITSQITLMVTKLMKAITTLGTQIESLETAPSGGVGLSSSKT